MTKKDLLEVLKVFAKRVLLKVVILVIAIFLLLEYVVGFYYYRGNSMFPNVKDGDFVVTWKLGTIQTNAVVTYKNDDGEMHIGRVVAKGGDEVSFTSDGELMVNGSVPSEEVFYATTILDFSEIAYPYTVPEDNYFILNDYRSGDTESFNDSRTYKSISQSNLNGEVILLIRRRGFWLCLKN